MFLSFHSKYIFFIRYVIIGLLSIILELFVYNFFLYFDLYHFLLTPISLLLGILFAFYFNIKFNFKISRSKQLRALIYFFLISIISWTVQFIISIFIQNENYEINRLFISGSIFIVFYILHRQYSFKDIKRVGVAIYINKDEDILDIHKKVEQYPDFIHVDIVDETFNSKAISNDLDKLKKIRDLWPKKEIHVHLMSTHPEEWIKKIYNVVDLIFIHWEIRQNVNSMINLIKKNNVKAGIALKINTDVSVIKGTIGELNGILLMSIDKLGVSGNVFNKKVISKISKIQKNFNSLNLRICADGGISENDILNINCEDVVSSSFVLKSDNPKLNIVRLKTSTQYEIL